MTKYKIETESGTFIFEIDNDILTAITLPFLVEGNAKYNDLREAKSVERSIIGKFKNALKLFLTGRFKGIDYSEFSGYWKLSERDFTNRVYQNVMKIPPGKTQSYFDVALKSGSTCASRAVGNIMRHNPFPLLIPCHRVIGSDGKMHGYAGKDGVQIKQKLLNWEKQAVRNPSRFRF